MKNLIKRAGPRDEIAAELGICPRTITRWVSGERRPTWEHMVALMRRAGVVRVDVGADGAVTLTAWNGDEVRL